MKRGCERVTVRGDHDRAPQTAPQEGPAVRPNGAVPKPGSPQGRRWRVKADGGHAAEISTDEQGRELTIRGVGAGRRRVRRAGRPESNRSRAVRAAEAARRPARKDRAPRKRFSRSECLLHPGWRRYPREFPGRREGSARARRVRQRARNSRANRPGHRARASIVSARGSSEPYRCLRRVASAGVSSSGSQKRIRLYPSTTDMSTPTLSRWIPKTVE